MSFSNFTFTFTELNELKPEFATLIANKAEFIKLVEDLLTLEMSFLYKSGKEILSYHHFEKYLKVVEKYKDNITKNTSELQYNELHEQLISKKNATSSCVKYIKMTSMLLPILSEKLLPFAIELENKLLEINLIFLSKFKEFPVKYRTSPQKQLNFSIKLIQELNLLLENNKLNKSLYLEESNNNLKNFDKITRAVKNIIQLWSFVAENLKFFFQPKLSIQLSLEENKSPLPFLPHIVNPLDDLKKLTLKTSKNNRHLIYALETYKSIVTGYPGASSQLIEIAKKDGLAAIYFEIIKLVLPEIAKSITTRYPSLKNHLCVTTLKKIKDFPSVPAQCDDSKINTSQLFKACEEQYEFILKLLRENNLVEQNLSLPGKRSRPTYQQYTGLALKALLEYVVKSLEEKIECTQEQIFTLNNSTPSNPKTEKSLLTNSPDGFWKKKKKNSSKFSSNNVGLSSVPETHNSSCSRRMLIAEKLNQQKNNVKPNLTFFSMENSNSLQNPPEPKEEDLFPELKFYTQQT